MFGVFLGYISNIWVVIVNGCKVYWGDWFNIFVVFNFLVSCFNLIIGLSWVLD